MDWAGVYPALLFMGLQRNGRPCICPYTVLVVNGLAERLSFNMIRESIIVWPTSQPEHMIGESTLHQPMDCL
jgi:hypothetical protein